MARPSDSGRSVIGLELELEARRPPCSASGIPRLFPNATFAREVVEFDTQTADGVISTFRMLVEPIVGRKAPLFHSRHEAVEVIGEPKQRLVHLPGLLRRQVIAVH